MCVCVRTCVGCLLGCVWISAWVSCGFSSDPSRRTGRRGPYENPRETDAQIYIKRMRLSSPAGPKSTINDNIYSAGRPACVGARSCTRTLQPTGRAVARTKTKAKSLSGAPKVEGRKNHYELYPTFLPVVQSLLRTAATLILALACNKNIFVLWGGDLWHFM